MEEKGISEIIYIVISIVFVLFSFVFRKKKQQEPIPVPTSFPKVDTAPEDFFPKQSEETKEETFVPVKDIPRQKIRSIYSPIEVIPEEDETQADHRILKHIDNNKASNDSSKQHEVFDPVKAVIYTEIMNRKY